MKRFRLQETDCAKAWQRMIIRVLCLFLLMGGFSGCTVLKDGKPPGDWHEAYVPIDEPESLSFVSNALALAVTEFGAPVIPVEKVMLRRSVKSEKARGYAVREHFSLTECIDTTNGVFVIYIGVDPDHHNYYALLGHECAHLLNPHITDWYMEGMATVFSEEVCHALGKEWGSWKRHFGKSRRQPYALSYRMMKEMKAACPEDYSGIQRFSMPNGHGGGWQMININGWLSTLPDEKRAEALELIEPNVKMLSRHTNVMYSFQVPDELGEK